jgi:hypothetical protein
MRLQFWSGSGLCASGATGHLVNEIHTATVQPGHGRASMGASNRYYVASYGFLFSAGKQHWRRHISIASVPIDEEKIQLYSAVHARFGPIRILQQPLFR